MEVNFKTRIMITGGTGFLGKALMRELSTTGYINLIQLSRKDGDLRSQNMVNNIVYEHKPEIIIHLAANVGGIGANMKRPAEFFYDNITMGVNLIDAANRYNVKKFVQIGTICAYPKFTRVPFREENIWDGYPEETNAPYGVAKKALLTMLSAYRQQYGLNSIYLLPVNLYGPGDNFSPDSSHVIPALIRKFTEYKQGNIVVWGNGKATREFLYVDDCARGIRFAMERYNKPEPVNLGSGEEISIEELVNILKRQFDYNGEVVWDISKPNGQPRRCLDTTRAEQEFGFKATTPLEEGLEQTIKWFKENYNVDAAYA
jgi:GDP-L-fucose synthase